MNLGVPVSGEPRAPGSRAVDCSSNTLLLNQAHEPPQGRCSSSVDVVGNYGRTDIYSNKLIIISYYIQLLVSRLTRIAIMFDCRSVSNFSSTIFVHR